MRLHLGGFFWGDCSLSNTLFRRDAGALAAYLVDAETGELHPSLSDGQRAHDLADRRGERRRRARGRRGRSSAARGSSRPRRPPPSWSSGTSRSGTSSRARSRSADDERYRIDERLRRLNELGFDVEELELVAGEDGYRLRLNPRVVEPGHHRRRLHALTGLNAQENQARRLLNDLARLPRRAGPGGRPAGARDGRRAPLARRRSSSRRSRRFPPSSGASATPPRSSTRCSSTAGSSPSRRARTSG